MKLTAPQAYDIEKALIRGRVVDAVAIYRKATGAGLIQSKAAVEEIDRKLRKEKPGYFKDEARTTPGVEPARRTFGRPGLFLFLLVDALLFGAVIYYFMFYQVPKENNTGPTKSVSESLLDATPKILFLPEAIDTSSYSTAINNGETFRFLYREKIASEAYIARKGSARSREYDASMLEQKIKTARSALAAARTVPPTISLQKIPLTDTFPVIDGVMDKGEWRNANSLDIENEETRLFLQVGGDWLFIAGDVPGEKTANGYDQLRLYFHSGLLKKLVNERIHIGRGPGVTSIRQTRFRWQGEPPRTEEERWKKYKISDWGIYQYAVGTSSMAVGHRQYEAAIHLDEAGLHPGVPFTFYAEIETDPLKNSQGKFVERQYLGQLGSEEVPLWLVY